MSAAPSHWLGDDESKPAPGPLGRIQALVNTAEPSGADRLADPCDARPWLTNNGLLASDAELTESDLAMVRGVREALRALLVRNAGGPEPREADLAALQTVAEGGTARAVFDADGQVRLFAAGESLQQRLVELLLVMHDAQRDGSWTRLKACANEECRWAFYDKCRNRGGTWCDMSSCGNKLKNREFRARKRAAAAR